MTWRSRVGRLANINRGIVFGVLGITERGQARATWSRIARDPKFAYQEMANLLFMGSVSLAAVFPWPWFWLLQHPVRDSLFIAAAKYAVIVWPIVLGASGYLECLIRSAKESDLLVVDGSIPRRVDVFGNSRVLAASTAVGCLATFAVALVLGSVKPF